MDEIFQLYEKFKLSIKETQKAFASVPKTEYFYELCFCLLTPATKAEHALRAIEILKRKKFFELGFNPVNVLRGYETDGTPTIKFYIRFHNTKSETTTICPSSLEANNGNPRKQHFQFRKTQTTCRKCRWLWL
jgi:hypothetical protein